MAVLVAFWVRKKCAYFCLDRVSSFFSFDRDFGLGTWYLLGKLSIKNMSSIYCHKRRSSHMPWCQFNMAMHFYTGTPECSWCDDSNIHSSKWFELKLFSLGRQLLREHKKEFSLESFTPRDSNIVSNRCCWDAPPKSYAWQTKLESTIETISSVTIIISPKKLGFWR